MLNAARIDTADQLKVIVADNYHYQDRENHYLHGAFETAEAAIDACKMIVDRCLKDLLEAGMTPEGLFQAYRNFGDDPYVVGPPNVPRLDFSAWDYAEERCPVVVSASTGIGAD